MGAAADVAARPRRRAHADRPARRVAERPLLRAADGAGRQGRHVRAVHPARRRAGGQSHRDRAADLHVAGLQLLRRERRRQARLVVRRPEAAQRLARTAVPQLGQAAALPHAAARVPALPRAHGQAGGLPLRRRPREVRVGRRPREAVRPRHLLGSRGVRDAADLRRRAALPRSRRQPRVPLGEQLLPACRAVERAHLARPALARRRPARVGADRRPVRRQRPRRPRGAVRRHAAGRGAVVVQRHLGRGRHAALNGAVRDRVRCDHTVLAAGHGRAGGGDAGTARDGRSAGR